MDKQSADFSVMFSKLSFWKSMLRKFFSMTLISAGLFLLTKNMMFAILYIPCMIATFVIIAVCIVGDIMVMRQENDEDD